MNTPLYQHIFSTVKMIHLCKLLFVFDVFSGVGQASTKGANFDDLLSSQGFTASSKRENRTMNEIKKEEMVKEMDPEKLKVRGY